MFIIFLRRKYIANCIRKIELSFEITKEKNSSNYAYIGNKILNIQLFKHDNTLKYTAASQRLKKGMTEFPEQISAKIAGKEKNFSVEFLKQPVQFSWNDQIDRNETEFCNKGFRNRHEDSNGSVDSVDLPRNRTYSVSKQVLLHAK